MKVTDWQPRVRTYDATAATDKRLQENLRLVRSDAQPPVDDPIANAAHDNTTTVLRFYHDVLGRDGIDGAGSPVTSLVHARLYRRDGSGAMTGESMANIAAWDGQRMLYGDGDGERYGPFANSLDVVAHELTHGVAQTTAQFQQGGQTGAIAESWGDVMGELVQLWHAAPDRFNDPAAARAHRWVSGEQHVTPKVPGDFGRSLEAPEIAHTAQYVNWPVQREYDMGGVHRNLGIPNKAAHEAATRIGGLKLAHVWYRALTDYLTPDADFSQAARSTIQAAADLYADPGVSQAVRDAWATVGVSPDHPIDLPPLTIPERPKPQPQRS